MRIGVRNKCQRQGIGRKLMTYLFNRYPNHLSLDVSSDNEKAVQFYHKCGLTLVETYLSEDKVEFNKFETPLGFIPPSQRISDSPKQLQQEEIKIEENSCSAAKKIESDDDTLVSESELSESFSQAAMTTTENTVDENIAREE